MAKQYNTFDELHSDYAIRFGDDWVREELTEEQELEFVYACYDIYPKEFNMRDSFYGLYSDYFSYSGRPFEIIEPVIGNKSWDLEALPVYKIKFTDNGELFEAYPEEIFDCFVQ